MKITKRQLRRIIKEEKTRVLAEQRAKTVDWWIQTIYDPIDEFYEFGMPQAGPGADMILQALEEILREFKGDLDATAQMTNTAPGSKQMKPGS